MAAALLTEFAADRRQLLSFAGRAQSRAAAPSTSAQCTDSGQDQHELAEVEALISSHLPRQRD